MRKSLFVFLLLAAAGVHAQIEPASWFGYWGWLSSLNAGDVVKHEEYLRQHAFHARMHHPFRREADLEMDLRDRLGGGLTAYKGISFTEKEVHMILKGRNENSWLEATLQFNQGVITAIELHQIVSPEPCADETCRLDSWGPIEPEQPPLGHGVSAQDAPPASSVPKLPVPKLPAPKLLSPDEGVVFDHFPRETTVRWDPVSGATGYWLEWDYEDSSGWHGNSRIPVSRIEVAQTGYTFEFVGAQAGHWRVSAFDESGVIGTPSEWRRFRYLR